MTGGPFYDGAQPLPSQNTEEFDTARAAKIDEITAEADGIVKACEAAKPAMAELRTAYADYLEIVYKADPAVKDIALETLSQVALVGTKEAIGEAQYASLASQEPTQAYTADMAAYLAVSKAVDVGGLYLEDVNTIAGYAAVMIDGLADSSDAKVKAANSDLDLKMEKLLGDALKALEPVAAGIANVNAGLEQLASADYYFSREALGWMDSQMAELGPLVDGLEPREGMTAEDVQAIKGFYAATKEWNGALNEHFASLDTSRVIAVPGVPMPGIGPEPAYAADGGKYEAGKDYGAANDVLQMQAKAEPPKEGWLSSGWGAVKGAFGKAKTVVGTGVDVLNAGVYNISRVGTGIWYGNSGKDIADDIGRNTKDLVDNYKNGVSGADTLKTAGDYIDDVEKGAGEAAGGATSWTFEKIFGKGKISGTAGWAVGGLTKITTGMFTGMAKGIYKVANKKSSSADVAVGIVEIVLGAIGGSKVILKGSQIPGLLKGAKEGIGAFSKTLTSLVGSAVNAAERKQVSKAIVDLLIKKGLTKAEAMNLVSNSIKLEINQAVGQLIKSSRDAMIKKIRDLIAGGGAGFLSNAKETIKGSLADLLSKGFPKTLQGYLDAGTTIIGANATDYLDNLIAAGLTDGLLTELITSALAVPPDPAQVNGSWSGSLIIVKVDIPESEQKTADEAGCEQVFKQLEGKKQAATFVFKLNDSGSGTVTMNAQGSSGSGPATYSDGALKMTVTSQGTTYTMSGTVAFEKNGGMKMSGSWTAPYQKSKIMMSGTFSAAK
ncbi:MAG: hypothetical protein Q8K99_06875 [Actinomycetota bacterium]|nr:hypothetical protein [Actinomycetota bacterium]